MAVDQNNPPIYTLLPDVKIPHPPSTNFYENDADNDFPSPAAKRLKSTTSGRRESPNGDSLGSNDTKKLTRDDVSDSEPEKQDHEDWDVNDPGGTQLETALPAVQTDEEAIEAYEAYKAGEQLSDFAPANGDAASRLETGSYTRGRSSIYVDAFNLALDTVLEDEGHLFNEAELQLFKEWRELSYEAQYLYARLFLRKTSKWFRVRDLQYYQDVADMAATVAELQRERKLPVVQKEEEANPGELEPPEGSTLGDGFVFAECSTDHITTLDEASSLLLLDELKDLAKDVKVRGKNKRELLQNFRRTSGRQAGLGFTQLQRTETEESSGSGVTSEDGRSTYSGEDDDGEEDSEPTRISGKSLNRDAHFTKKILDRTGRCIRLSLAPLHLFERVHLVFYRSTEWTEKSLTTLILARISRRNFPQYIVSRSANIFETRSLLREFEASLRTQFRVDNILEFNGTPGRKHYQEVLNIFEAVYPRWQVLATQEQLKEERIYESGEGAYLRRFSPAWVYTRIIHKALYALARFKEYLREHALLTELLDQRLFHVARRGSWYQRKALIEEHYMHTITDSEGRNPDANKKHWKRIALNTCETGLQDRECHIIYHYDLQKRIKKLEKQLRLPMREQHDFGHVRLGKPTERDVVGIKIEREHTPMPTVSRQYSIGTDQKASDVATKPPALVHQATSGAGIPAKTIWLDSLDTNEYVGVESMCLSHYRHVLGYKGYHSEGGVLRTLFGLLFYDILFFNPYIPNVFQTAYQTCPLDLHTDSFYSSRVHEIQERVGEISNGRAVQIVARTWDENVENRTCIVGVRWDNFEREDLLELVSCWNGAALGTVMQVMAQEYAARGGGVPDLILWRKHTGEEAPSGDDLAQGEILFSEVKSKNDKLSDTQRLWIDVLLGAGVKVELCHAVAGEVRTE